MRFRPAALALLLSGCGTPPPNLLATDRAPTIPAECRDAVYNDPEVHQIMLANIASPTLIGENQDKLAFAQDEALRKCLRAKGLLPEGGVEPVRYRWYSSPL